MNWLKKYLANVFLGLDFLGNALAGGDPEETISSRIGKKMAKEKKCYLCTWLCWVLDKIDPRHCRDAINIYEGHGSDDDDSMSGV